jgi:hypothetical protein
VGWWIVGLAVILAIVGWQAFLAFGGPFEKSLNWTIDDAFYYLKVADSVARGDGSTFDGRHETNGYHPLWMLALVPVVRATAADPIHAVRAVQALQCAILLGTLFLLWSCARRLLPPPGAVLALVLFAWPRVLTQTNSMLESGLFFFLLFALLARLLGGFPGEPEVPRPGAGIEGLGAAGRRLGAGPSRVRRDLVTGLVAALVFLCRLDSVFLFAAFGLSLLVTRPRRVFRMGTLAFCAPVLALGGAYLAWNARRFGHLVPVSGMLKTTYPQAAPHWEYLRAFPEFALFAAIGGAWWLRDVIRAWTGRTRGTVPSPIAIFGLAALLHFIYTLLFMAWGVENWHFCLGVPAGILLLGWGATRAVNMIARGNARRAAPIWAVVVIAAAGAMAAGLASSRARHRDLLLEHYHRAALWARDRSPRDAVFAMTDAGIFAWFSERTTINTDGLINDFDYVETLRRGAFAEYLAREGVDHVMDYWNWGAEPLLRGGYGMKTIRARLRPSGAEAGAIDVSEADEVYRDVFRARNPATRAVEENALLIWRVPR